MIIRISKVIWRGITSKTLALWLIIFLAILSSVGMLIPQSTYNPSKYTQWAKSYDNLSNIIEQLQLHQVFHSYIFLTITLVFTLNLICCTIKQLISVYKKNTVNFQTRPIYSDDAQVMVHGNLITMKRELKTLLRKQRYRVKEHEFILIAEKGRSGLWGGPIFHVGLILIILGGIITNYFSMEGYFRVSEGEVFQETHEGYLKESIKEAPLFKEDNHIGYQLKLEKQERFFKGKLLNYVRSYITVEENDSNLNSNGVIELGQPFKYKGFTFYHKDSGFSPQLKFRKNGQDLGTTFFSLNTTRIGSSNHFTYTGDFNNFQTDGYVLKISFFPDLVAYGDNQYDYDSMDDKNPALYIEVLKNGQSISAGLVKKGQWIQFGDFELSFGDTIYWVGLDVVKDPGANVLFLGFYISILGLILLYVIVPKQFSIEIRSKDEEITCKVAGMSRKYQLFFKEEFKELVEKISKIGEGTEWKQQNL